MIKRLIYLKQLQDLVKSVYDLLIQKEYKVRYKVNISTNSLLKQHLNLSNL